MMRWIRGDDGSTIPLIMGCFLLALLIVAGSVAAGQAFVQQRDLQSVCDGAALAAASAVDANSYRHPAERGEYLELGDVQTAVDGYLSRDPSRGSVHVDASLTSDGAGVTAACTMRSNLAFGAMFGFSNGITHNANSSARAPVS